MMRTTKLFVLALALPVVALGCSSSSSGGAAANGPPRGEKMSDITPAQEAALCDSVAPTFGGYGAAPKTVTCPDGSTLTLKPYASQSACVAGIGAPPSAACPATIGDAEDCLTEAFADPCSQTPSAACENYFNAACSLDSEPDGGTTETGPDDAATETGP